MITRVRTQDLPPSDKPDEVPPSVLRARGFRQLDNLSWWLASSSDDVDTASLAVPASIETLRELNENPNAASVLYNIFTADADLIDRSFKLKDGSSRSFKELQLFTREDKAFFQFDRNDPTALEYRQATVVYAMLRDQGRDANGKKVTQVTTTFLKGFFGRLGTRAYRIAYLTADPRIIRRGNVSKFSKAPRTQSEPKAAKKVETKAAKKVETKVETEAVAPVAEVQATQEAPVVKVTASQEHNTLRLKETWAELGADLIQDGRREVGTFLIRHAVSVAALEAPDQQ